MRVLILGASGGIGAHVRRLARERGHELVLYAREPARLEPLSEREMAVRGEMTDRDTLAQALAGIDAVISVLGPTTNARDEVVLFETFSHVLVEAMEATGVRRLVTISGGACTLPGERKPARARLASAVVRFFVRYVVAAKQRELEAVAASNLEWTAPRPPRVTDAPATGHWRAGTVEQGLRITQGDFAAFMVEQLTSDDHVRQAPYVSN